MASAGVVKTDVIVIGGGAMGTATGWALAKRGVKTIVLEQFDHVHAMGSHGGKTRIFRHAYAEGEKYVHWTLEADKLWSDLQERTADKFMFRVGCIDISAPGFHRAKDAYASSRAYGIESEWLTGADVNKRWPAWNLPEDREVCFGAKAGFLSVEIGLKAMASELREAGSQLIENTTVTGWKSDGSTVRVTTDQGTYEAEQLVLTAGAWSVDVLKDLNIPLRVVRKPVIWFEAADPSLIQPERFPCFISDDETGEFYGIPQYAEPGVKVGMHSGGQEVHPNTVNREFHVKDANTDVLPFLQRTIPTICGKVLSWAVCMYTMTPDEDFVIDRHPEHSNVVLATGFSGHGFKFSPVVGEYLATLATDPGLEVKPDFATARFN